MIWWQGTIQDSTAEEDVEYEEDIEENYEDQEASDELWLFLGSK